MWSQWDIKKIQLKFVTLCQVPCLFLHLDKTPRMNNIGWLSTIVHCFYENIYLFLFTWVSVQSLTLLFYFYINFLFY